VKFVATKKRYDNKFFSPSLLLLFLDPGSGMGKNQDPKSGINIPDPQHCYLDPDMTVLRNHRSSVNTESGSVFVLYMLLVNKWGL
jgi:hypothetical protein